MSTGMKIATIGCLAWIAVGTMNPASAQGPFAARKSVLRQLDLRLQNSADGAILFRAIKRNYPEVYARALNYFYGYLVERKDDQLPIMQSELQAFISNKIQFIDFAPDEQLKRYFQSAYAMMVYLQKEDVTECVAFIKRPAEGLSIDRGKLSPQAREAFFQYEAYMLDAAKAGESAPVESGELDQNDSDISSAIAVRVGLTPERVAITGTLDDSTATQSEKCSFGVAISKFYAELPPQIARKILSRYDKKRAKSAVNADN